MEPAAIRLVISQGELVVLNRTVDHSQQVAVPELLGLVLNVSLDHFDDAIGLEVCVCVCVCVCVRVCVYMTLTDVCVCVCGQQDVEAIHSGLTHCLPYPQIQL